MSHPRKPKVLFNNPELITLLAATGIGTAVLVFSGGLAEARGEATNEIEIQGKALNQPMPGAIVTAHCAGQQFMAQADSQGRYRLHLRLPANKAAAPVQLSAQGVGAQAAVVLASYPGSFAALVAQAGADAVLNAAENPRVQITAISSAEAALVDDELGHAPNSAEELVTALKLVDVGEVLDLAATLQMMAAEPGQYPLPEGLADSQAFARARKLREDTLRTLQTQAPDLLAQAEQRLVQDPELRQQGMAANVLPAELLAVETHPDIRHALAGGQWVMALQFDNAGSGSISDSSYHCRIHWSARQGEIQVISDAPKSHETTAWLDTNQDGEPDAEVRLVHQAVETKISLLGNGMAAVVTRSVISHPDLPSLADESETNLRAVRLFNPQQDYGAVVPESFANTGGRVLTETFQPRPEGRQFAATVLQLKRGGSGVSSLQGSALSWTQTADGALATSLPGTVQLRYHGLPIAYRNAIPGLQIALAEVSTAGGRYVELVKLVSPAEPMPYTAANVPGVYLVNGFGEFKAGFKPDTRVEGFRLRFAADGTGYQGSDRMVVDAEGRASRVATDNSGTPDNFFRWSVDAGTGALWVRRYRDAEGRGACTAGAAGCQLYDERELTAFGGQGAGQFVMQKRRLDYRGRGGSKPVDSRVMVLDKG